MQEVVMTQPEVKTGQQHRKTTPDVGTGVKLEWRRDGQLWASRNGTEIPVSVKRCFPWSEPGSFISLRDDDEDEFALIEDLQQLDDVSRSAVESALVEAGFILEIQSVEQLIEDFEIRNWKVTTRQGLRTFQTRLDDWPDTLPSGGIIIRDVSGDLFFIKDADQLDEHSRKLLWAFID